MDSSSERVIRSRVPGEYRGWRIDRYLAERFSYLSRSQWQREISGGRITLNGELIWSPHLRIIKDDIVEYDPFDRGEPDVDFGYSVLHEDDQLIAVNKTGNLPVHPSGRFFHNTLLSHLQEKTGMKLYTVHRLDRETSGVMLFAKSAGPASDLQKNLKSAMKSYIAVVRGIPEQKSFIINVPIGKDRSSKISKKRAAFKEAEEEAETSFSVTASAGGYSLIKAVLGTGRLHQIRVHLEYSGYPIVGDKLYGGNEDFYLEFVKNGNTVNAVNALGFHRCALHSQMIEFRHPAGGERMFIKAPLPEDLSDLVKGIFGDGITIFSPLSGI